MRFSEDTWRLWECATGVVFGVALHLTAAACMAADQRVLRVCADPNNLPFSNSRGEGFENRMAELIARDLGAKLEYTWLVERKLFVRNTLDQGRCEMLFGVPSSLDSVTTTKAYYRSTYAFVSRHDRKLDIASLDDPRLEKLRIGVHVVGDDLAPPAAALARRGLAANLVGYSLFGAYGEENPPARLIEALARGDVDVAIVWGPFAGYFAKHLKIPLDVLPVSPAMFLVVPFVYEMSVGVRKGDNQLKDELDAVLARECRTIQAFLAEFGIPQAGAPQGKETCEASSGSRPASPR